MINKINDKIKDFLQEEKKRRILRLSFLFGLVFLMLLTLVSHTRVKENGEYTDFRHIVAYIFKYDDLPSNYIPKINSGLVDGEELYLYEPFMNNEGLLPPDDYISAYYNATKTDPGQERIVFSDSNIYYTEDHYLSYNRITRFDINGLYYISISCFWIMLVVGGVFTFIVIKRGYISITIIKEDINKDYLFLLNKSKGILGKLRAKLFERND